MKPELLLKRSFTFVILIVAHCFAVAQTAKGDWLVEGSLGNLVFSYNDYSQVRKNSSLRYGNSTISVNLTPRTGYFLTPNLVIGLAPNIFYSSTGRTDKLANGNKSYNYKDVTTEIDCELFLRFYFKNYSVKNRLYIQPGIGIGFAPYRKNSSTFYESDGTTLRSKSELQFQNPTNQLFGKVMIGFNHFFNEHVALNTAVGYNYSKSQISYAEKNYDSSYPGYTTTEPKITVTNTIYSFVWNLGFTFFFNKEKK